MTLLSAVIPTRDRPELLRDCLATLLSQDAPEGSLEVVVVDDGSTADLALVVKEAAVNGLPVRHERQDPAGLNVARNRGAEVTAGDVIAYLDDDTLVAPGWAAAVVAGFEQWGCDGLGGRVRLRLEGPEPGWLSPGLRELLAELDLGVSPRWLARGQYPVGANCAVTRAAFEKVGGFAAGLDRVGTSLVSNGDTDFFDRVRRSGGRLAYWPAAEVEHRVPPSRLEADFFVRRGYAQGVSDEAMHGLPAPAGERATRLAREALRAGRALPILARNLARGQGTVSARVWLAYSRGRLDALRGRSRA